MKIEEKALLISNAIQEWLINNNKIETQPEEVMTYLKEKGVYSKNRKSASQLRSDLRKLSKLGKLYLVKGADFEQKKKNKYWYFNRI